MYRWGFQPHRRNYFVIRAIISDGSGDILLAVREILLHPARAGSPRRARNRNVHRLSALRHGRGGPSAGLRPHRPATAVMSGDDGLIRENAYLKVRIAQLQSDVADLSAEIDRLRQER